MKTDEGRKNRMRNRIVLTLDASEAKALDAMARQAHRYPKQQLKYLLYRAANEAGLLENESGDGVSVDRTTVTRLSQTAAA